MSIVETVLIYAVIPVGFCLLVAAVVMGPSAARTPRYRPGGGWQYQPVWYLPHPDHSGPVSSLEAAGLNEASSRLALHGSVPAPVEPSGGASGEW
jgi:hypothetical protein